MLIYAMKKYRKSVGIFWSGQEYRKSIHLDLRYYKIKQDGLTIPHYGLTILLHSHDMDLR